MKKLVYEEVVAKAREYYEAGKLAAQHPDPDKRACAFQTEDGYRCAVGAGLDDEMIAKLSIHSGAAIGNIQSLIRIGALGHDSNEVGYFCKLQRRHDEWCNAAKFKAPETEAHRAAFEELIGVSRAS